MFGREILADRWVRASIDSIVRTLLVAVTISAAFAAMFLVVGLSEIAVPFVLATAIGFGLVVVSVVWRALTRAHSAST
jgi:hypothetical protein